MMENSANFSDNERSGCCCESDADSISLTRGFDSYNILVGDYSVQWCEWVTTVSGQKYLHRKNLGTPPSLYYPL